MPFRAFDAAALSHFTMTRQPGNAATQVISAKDFARAHAEITLWPGYAETPLHALNGLADTLNLGAVMYKDEGPRFGLGSFKALGAAYAGLRVLQAELSKSLPRTVLAADIRSGALADQAAKITLCSATDGNHGRSLAWGCQRFGAACKIYIHAEVSEARADAMRALGADVIRIEGNYDDSVAQARQDAATQGWHVVSDTSWPGYSATPLDVMAGYGVIAVELSRALPEPPTHVFLQAGVGGFAAAIAAAFRQVWGKDSPRVVVVEPDLAPCLLLSAKAGCATPATITSETVMAGLSCGEPSEIAWEILAQETTDFITIPDSLIAPTMRLLARPTAHDPKIDAGESGVAGLAALIATARQPKLREALHLTPESRVLLIGSEGITDPKIHARLLA